jgi:hypothetical protein
VTTHRLGRLKHAGESGCLDLPNPPDNQLKDAHEGNRQHPSRGWPIETSPEPQVREPAKAAWLGQGAHIWNVTRSRTRHEIAYG